LCLLRWIGVVVDWIVCSRELELSGGFREHPSRNCYQLRAICDAKHDNSNLIAKERFPQGAQFINGEMSLRQAIRYILRAFVFSGAEDDRTMYCSFGEFGTPKRDVMSLGLQ